MYEHTLIEWSGTGDVFFALLNTQQEAGWDYCGSVVLTENDEQKTRLVFRRLSPAEADRMVHG